MNQRVRINFLILASVKQKSFISPLAPLPDTQFRTFVNILKTKTVK